MFLADNIIIQIIKSLHDIDRISFVMTCHKFWRLKAHLTFYCFPNKTITIQQLLEQHRLHGSNNVTEEILYNCITPPTANISNVVTNDPSSSSSTSTSSSSSIQKRKGGTFNLGSFQDNYIKSILYTLVVDDSINAEISGANGGLDSEEKFEDSLKSLFQIPASKNIKKILFNNSKYSMPSKCDWIPNHVISVAFGSYYDLPIPPHSIPLTVTSLSFGPTYNKPLLPGSIPSGLFYLDMGTKFNHPITKSLLPDTIKLLVLSESFGTGIELASIPSHCTYLQLGRVFNQPLTQQDLFANSSLENLVFGMNYNQEILPDVLPQTIKTIHFFNQLERPFFNTNWLPTSLTKILISKLEFELVPGIFSYLVSLRSLSIELYFHRILPGTLPPNLEKLKVAFRFNHALEEGSLPDTLQSLALGDSFNSAFNRALPRQLKKLTMGDAFNHNVAQGELPETLTHLSFGRKFDQPIHQYHIPPAIEILKFGADLSVDNISSVRFPTTLKTLELFQYPFTQDELNQLKKASSSSSSSSSTTTSKKKSIATKFLSIFKKKKKDIVVAVEEIQPQPQPQQPTEEVKEIVEDEIIEEIVEDETKFKFKLPNQLQSFTTSSQSIPLIFNHLPKSVDTLIIFFIDKKGNNKKKDVTIKFPATIPSHIKNIELHVSSSQANFRPYFPVSALTNIESLSLQNPFTKVLKCRRTGQDHLFVLSSEIEDSNNGFISIKENESKNVLESFQFSDYSWLNEFFV